MNELKQNAFYESVNSAKRFLRKRFRVNKLRLRTICCITFPACN
ncbi:hypothetical protein [Leptospira noguchii]|nr:hypothetical protein [Leptospira noguchii]